MYVILGWEYCVEAGLGGWVSFERTIHLCRRRRWVRTRIRVNDPKVAEKKVHSSPQNGEIIVSTICKGC